MAQSDANPREETRVGHCKRDTVDIDIGRDRAGDTIKHMANTEIGKPGWLGNPFVMESKAKPLHREQDDIMIVEGREAACERFMQVLLERVDDDPEFRRALYQRVQGKRLGCWCQSLDEDGPACHGEQLARVADAINKQEQKETVYAEDAPQ